MDYNAPWRVVGCRLKDASENTLADLRYTKMTGEKSLLLSAAPDLLAACVKAHDYIVNTCHYDAGAGPFVPVDRQSKCVPAMLLEAIAKAER